VLLVWFVAVTVPLAQTLILDRILAVVSGNVIMRSDVRAFIDLQLVNVVKDKNSKETALTKLIERRIVLDEIDRYVATDPSPMLIEQGLIEVEARFSSRNTFVGVLERVGYTIDDLRQVLTENTRRDIYLNSRFLSVRPPSEDQLRDYFEEHKDAFVTPDQTLIFEELRPLITERLIEEFRAEMVSDWVAGLVRQSVVVRMTPE
jgi:hypothetical protein